MGGSACIFACQAAKLGLRVAVLGRVGADPFGELVTRRLQESNVDTCYVTVDPSLKTGVGVSLCRTSGDRAILTYGGSLNAVFPEDVTDDFLRSGSHLHYASYYLQTNLLSAAPAMLRRARELGLTTSLDTNWDPAEQWDACIRSALAASTLFLPSGQEALAIARDTDIQTAACRLASLGPIVVAKLGECGAGVQSSAGWLEVPVEPVPGVVDTIGAGDSFDGGFIAAWLRGLSLRQCAVVGNACGRANTQARGGVQGQSTLAELEAQGMRLTTKATA